MKSLSEDVLVVLGVSQILQFSLKLQNSKSEESNHKHHNTHSEQFFII